MRRIFVRSGSVAALLVGILLAPLAELRPVQAQLKANVPPVAKPDEATPKPEGYQSFAFPEDRDAKQRLKAVTDYLEKKTVPWDVVCGTAQQLLDSKSDSFYPITETPDGKKVSGSRVSVKAKINDLIGHFPKEGKQFYELTFGPAADAMLKDALAARYDRPAMAEVAQRYFHTKAGGQATLLLASFDLESGNYAEAAYGFQRLLDRPESDDFLTPRTLLKAAVAFKRSGDPRQAETTTTLMTRLEKKFPRDGLTVGRKTYAFEELKKELDRATDDGLGRLGDAIVSTRYGNNSHTGRGEGGTPFLDPSFSVPMLFRTDDNNKDGSDWVRQNIDYALRQLDPGKKQVAIPGFFPATAPNVILYRTFDGVYAVVTKDGFVSLGRTYRAGELLWMTPTQGGAQSLMSGDDRQQAQMWWMQYWQPRMPSVLFENAQVGSLSHDGKQVYFVDDLSIPPPAQLFNPNMPGGMMPNPPGGAGMGAGVRGMSDFSRLVAVDLDTGLLKWSLGGLAATALTEQEEEKSTNTLRLTENALFLGPPLTLNGKIYLLFERNSQIKLACLDPYRVIVQPAAAGRRPERYPELIWMQNLGAPNSRLSQDSLRRIQPAYLAYADGVIVCPTNSGAVVAVDVNARSLLWAQYYGTSTPVDGTAGGGAMPGAPFGGRRPIPQPFGSGPLPLDRWRAAAPIITNGKVVLTAHDSEKLQCLDLRTGALVWEEPRQKEDLFLGGVIDGKVLVIGKETVRAYNLEGDKGKSVIAWQNLRIGTPCGHGVAAKDGFYYLPIVGTPDQKDGKEPQVWAIDVATGQAPRKASFRRKDALQTDPRLALGNLLFHEGQLYAQSGSDITAFPLMELKKQEMARLLKDNPNDPVGLAARGELSLDNGDIKDAVADFKKSLANNPPDAVRRKLRQKLYVAYTELIRNDFPAGEQYLGEYEALCEVPTDTEDPAEKKRLMDEQLRRRGLFLSLKAKGREKQGRLVEAFDSYREFAGLDDNKQLVAIYDEPNGLTRPDVWARGRIDAMIRGAKDPAVRKPLEDRVAKDWEAVRTANDLPRLREFVKVFGPYFALGRDAQLLLAEKLLLTNNDDDMRDAQTQLLQLWATSEDATTTAKAIEALARVMTRRGMLEDAVGLYIQLGTKYPDAVIRDGKTGADIYGELITDKRLLPYLEPGRGPSAGNYKVDVQLGQQNARPFIQSFSLKPDGNLFPFFRRFNLALEQSQNGDGTFVLRATDRTTGEEWCKFTGLNPIQTNMGINTGAQGYKLAQAHGHLLLVSLGQIAYCFDLAQKRMVWQQNLLGPSAGAVPPPQTVNTPDGDTDFIYPDGWRLRLGRSAVVQPTYTCLVTRDGLLAVDSTTGERLWIRNWKPASAAAEVQVFGDARYVFVVEGSSSRVLRAVDGTVVPGSNNFAAIMTSPAKVAIVGRNVLLNEGGTNGPRILRLYDPLTGDDVWKKEFPQHSLLLKTMDPTLTGCITPTGTFEVLAVNTGATVFQSAIDTDRIVPHLTDASGKMAVVNPLLLTDSDRFYLFLNKPADAASGRVQVFYGGGSVRAALVNGAAYGFDRATGKRLWYNDKLFENQQVFLERFDDLPAIVAANTVQESNGQMSYQVVVLDKQAGKLRYYRPHVQNGVFQTVYVDPKTRAVEFWRYDLRVRIAPDEPGR